MSGFEKHGHYSRVFSDRQQYLLNPKSTTTSPTKRTEEFGGFKWNIHFQLERIGV